jgi:hypothetical protein
LQKATVSHNPAKSALRIAGSFLPVYLILVALNPAPAREASLNNASVRAGSLTPATAPTWGNRERGSDVTKIPLNYGLGPVFS